MKAHMENIVGIDIEACRKKEKEVSFLPFLFRRM